MDPEFPHETVGRPVNVMELDCTMNRSEEGTVQPPTTLGDQFWNLIWHIGDGVGGLDVVKDP